MGLTVNIQTVTGQLCRLGNVLAMQRSCKDTYPSQQNAECALPEHVPAHLSELMVSAESFAFNLMHAYKLPQSIQADAPCTVVIGKSFPSCGASYKSSPTCSCYAEHFSPRQQQYPYSHILQPR